MGVFRHCSKEVQHFWFLKMYVPVTEDHPFLCGSTLGDNIPFDFSPGYQLYFTLLTIPSLWREPRWNEGPGNLHRNEVKVGIKEGTPVRG